MQDAAQATVRLRLGDEQRRLLQACHVADDDRRRSRLALQGGVLLLEALAAVGDAARARGEDDRRQPGASSLAR